MTKWISGKPLSIIVAIAQNRAIGKDNLLLWHIPDDLKRFKQITSGSTVVMGKKTFESLPFRPLKNRTNVVITDQQGEQIPGCKMAYSIQESLDLCDPHKENFIIGGASIYRQFLPLCDKLYITWVYKDFDADTFFPKIDEALWKLVSSEPGPVDPVFPIRYEYNIYERK